MHIIHINNKRPMKFVFKKLSKTYFNNLKLKENPIVLNKDFAI